MNKVILMGRLAREVDARQTPSGKTVARFTLAVDRRQGKNTQGQQTADFLNIVAWERLADFCSNYLQKGTKILLEGQLQSRSYEAQDGSKRYVTEVVARDIEFAESKGSQSTTQQIGQVQGTAVTDDDIPF
jgi:single-strand DNA-binding protein